MNAALLLEYYARIADAPDAIARLRTLVIALAIRGRITGYMGPWLTTTLGEIGRWGSGGTPSKAHPEYYGGTIPWLVIGDLNDGIVEGSQSTITRSGVENSAAKIVEPGAVLIAMYGSIGKLGINAMPCATNQAIAHCHPSKDCVTRDFLFWLLRSLREDLLGRGQGVAQQNISQKILKAWPVRLPTIAEQHRIVAKVDELMALCDQLEAARAEREAARDSFTLSTLAKLKTSDPETFGEEARFALANLAPLTARLDQIKQLRQTILNVAVRGKLVVQDAADEPAAALLKRTSDDIEAYCSENRVARAKPEPFAEDTAPFGAPSGWSWVRLCQLFRVVTDGDHQPPPRADQGIAFLTIGNVTTGRLDFDGCRLVPESYFRALPAYRTPAKGDILYTVVGATFGRPALVDSDRDFCVQRHIAILKPAKTMEIRFLLLLLASPLVYDQAASSTTGTAQPTIALRPLRNFAVPVPPLAEQHRIVAKVDALMGLCDQLEASITTGERTRSRLLKAVVHSALEAA